MTAVYVFLGFFALALVCFAIGAGDCIRTHWRIWREKRAIARRDADEAKRDAEMRKWGLLAFPRKPQRVSNRDIDPARRTGQFSIASPMRDMKGVNR